MRKRNFQGRTLFLNLSLLASIWIGISENSNATHIVGAELFYECIDPSNDLYNLKVKMYRDCLNGQAEYDDTIYVFVFRHNTQIIHSIIPIPLPDSIFMIVPDGWNNCIGQIYLPCVELAIYQVNTRFNSIPGGYDIAWARCCRNHQITNLNNPGCQGVTFLAHIPGPEDAACNSMPFFNNVMPTFICADQQFHLDHSATDPDGDSLAYSISNPYNGINTIWQGAGSQGANLPVPCLGPQPPPIVDYSNFMGPGPYLNAIYNAGFNFSNPFGTGSSIQIDPQSGFLSCYAANLGIYVIAISVKEFRNGILLSENKRDFQVHVVNCAAPQPAPSIYHDFGALQSNGDTIIVFAEGPFCFDVFVADTLNPLDTVYGQGISVFFQPNTPYPPLPTITTSGFNPIQIHICWTPDCVNNGLTIPLILMGWNPDNCADHNQVLDTIWIRIVPPPPAIPIVDHSLAGNIFLNDTIFIEVDSTLCFDWWVRDTSSVSGGLQYAWQVETLSGGGNISPSLSLLGIFADSIALRTCWTATCDAMGGLFRLILSGTHEGACPPENSATDTVYIRVEVLPNPSPVVTHDLSGNIFSGDTIIIDVHDTLCYSFVVRDTFPSVDLSYMFQIRQIDGSPAGGPSPIISIVDMGDSLLGTVCWIPNCDNVNGIFSLAVRGTQENRCNQFGEDYDTVFVIVNAENNPPPVIFHNFIPGFLFSGDTLIVAADSITCFEFSLRDTLYKSFLKFEAHVEILPSGDSTSHSVELTFSMFSDSLIQGMLCFTPGCDFLNANLRICLAGKDTFDCSTSNLVYDTIDIRVVDPYNNPPVISHDLTGLDVLGGVVQITPDGLEHCYTVTLLDPDSIYASLTAKGANELFDFYWGQGNPATVEISGTNPLNIRVCWNPSCYEELKDYTLLVCGSDTSRCAITPEVCDSVKFHINECTLDVQNVFSPNGDGINDWFLPFHQEGVEYFLIEIFDRWGKKTFESRDQGWDGNVNGREAPTGVYYYLVTWKWWSAKGVPLGDKIVGWVTLVR